MGEKFWIQKIGTGLDRLRVHFKTDHGQVKSIFVIQYEAYINGKWRAIVRFDEAHGFFHKDVISPIEKPQKTAILVHDKKFALTEAIDDIKKYWRFYRKIYEEKYYGKK
ncbi:hypothetical protein H8E88_16715 [candidate division KSB1 bacterium]|nr:hypothetical protein [candidate division KSB1 bacterium]MBL7093044.1 hypothetical protein [candidate division KSB1 bacterium]